MTTAKQPRPAPRPDDADSRSRHRLRTGTDASAELLGLIRQSLDDDQGDDVAVIDLTGKTAIADYMVIASGRNPRHIAAMAAHLKERVKAAGGASPPIEGLAQADWVLVDTGDVIVHLFRPEVRRLYNLEKMWGTVWPEDDTDDDGPGDTGAGHEAPGTGDGRG